jgi:hypothetical protein
MVVIKRMASQFMTVAQEAVEIITLEHCAGWCIRSCQPERQIIGGGSTEPPEDLAAGRRRTPRKIVKRKRDDRSRKSELLIPPGGAAGDLPLTPKTNAITIRAKKSSHTQAAVWKAG